MIQLENQKLADRICHKGKSYELILPWVLQDKHGKEINIHIDDLNDIDDDIGYDIDYKIAYSLSGFTSDGQYITVVSASIIEEDDLKFFLVVGKVKINKRKAIFKSNYMVDITDYFPCYPPFCGDEVEAAYNADCKRFCTFNLKYSKTAFFWGLASPDKILIKDLRKELNWLKDMSITIKKGSLSIINEHQIQLVGTREYKRGYSTTTVITYDFGLGAIVSVEDTGEPIGK
jgi:hypothetical protein